jgi:hypothetical protein
MAQERKQFQRTEDGHLILMSNEERKLLITDLTARINYGVICLIERVDDFGPIHRNEKLTGFCFDDIGGFHFEVGGGLEIVFAEKIIPYLRPLSSMTEEEIEELRQEHIKDEKLFAECLTKAANGDSSMRGKVIPHFAADWCNKNHFDYRGLIPMGLALEASEEMYN